ncbi:leukotriene-B4 omega-hydroxylase 3-like [Ptychodera flava]|uniref:leukotriene-B4 omega-hydroxylase 3-like n=1 Tax=Ptychodera flava TaxID=63121 RepID=UPI00396A3903
MGASLFRPMAQAVLTSSTGRSYFEVLVVALVTLFAVYIVKTFTRLMKMRWASEKALASFEQRDRHPIFGHLNRLSLNAEETVQIAGETTWWQPFGNQLWFGPFHCMLVCWHPSTIQPIMATAEPKDEFTYGMIKPWLGDGLLISKGNKWYRNRRLLTPGFHFDILKPYVDVFSECANTMTDKWMTIHQKGMIEMFEHISLMTLDSLFKCIFSLESQCQRDLERNPYISAVYKLSGLILERMNFPPYFSDFIYHLTYSGYTWRKALRTVHQHSNKVIKERRQAYNEEQRKGTTRKRKYIDFMDILLAARDEDGKGLTDQEIRDEVDTFMFEGHDTTASGLSWIMYNLARHPEHQKKCQEEIDELLDAKGEDRLEWDDLGKLPYLTMCIKESLRLHSPVPFIGRKLNKPITMPSQNGKVTIPAGERIGISIMSLHHHALVWEDPEIYNPLRFSPENSKDRSPHAFLPFSAGPRNCIGQNFAMNEMKVTTALVLRKFNLAVDEFRKIRRYNAIVLRSEGGLPLHVEPRKR